MALFIAVPAIEKINHYFPKFRSFQAGVIGACAGLLAGCMMAIMDKGLSYPGMSTYNTTAAELVLFSGVYGLLVHTVFKLSEKCHIAIRFLSVLTAMCAAFMLRFHPMVFQTAQPTIIPQLIVAAVASCSYIALFWWLTAERLKILYRRELVEKKNYFNPRWLVAIAGILMFTSIVSYPSMINLVFDYDNFNFKTSNNNQALRKSLTGKIYTRDYIYDCASNAIIEYPEQISKAIKRCWAFDCNNNVMCIADSTSINIFFSDSTKKEIRVDVGFIYISISPAGAELAGIGKDGCISIYEIASGKLVTKIQGDYTGSLCWSPDGKSIFAEHMYQDRIPNICRINIASGTVENQFPGNTPRLIQRAGKISYRDNDFIKILSPESGATVSDDKEPDSICGYTVSPCGKYLLYLKKKQQTSSKHYYSIKILVKKTGCPQEPGVILGEVSRGSSLLSVLAWQDSSPTQPKKAENAKLK
jgi:hypothetical protein